MQSPTLTGVRLRNTNDALKIFHAVTCRQLPMITRRLDFDERRQIKSGNIYVWEERNPSTNAIGLGIERWTDGRQYTPSRVRDEFLLYVAKDSEAFPPGSGPMDAAQVEANRLIKQTYSVYVADSDPRKKWHITAYYTPASLKGLATVDQVPFLRSMVVPQSAYVPARTAKHVKQGKNEGYEQQYSGYPEGSSGSSTTDRRRGSIAGTPGGMPYYAPYRTDGASLPMPYPQPQALPSPTQSSPTASSRNAFEAIQGQSSQPCNMVPLPLLQQSHQTRYRDPLDDNVLRRFPPSSN